VAAEAPGTEEKSRPAQHPREFGQAREQREKRISRRQERVAWR